MRHRLLPLLLVLFVAPPVEAQELTISVAISMKDAVQELGRGFTQSRTGVILRFNFGSSGELQKQIEAGAPVDLFISAAHRQMDDLEKGGLLLPGTRRAFARNSLTVIKPADSRLDLAGPAALLDPRVTRIAIGNPRTVPVGQYSEQSLRALGPWERLQPRIVLGENVRQVLEYVSRGEVDAGFVYTTDAIVGGGRVKEAFRPAEDTYSPVVYPAAVVRGTRYAALAQEFVGLLLSPVGQAALARLGFQPPPPGLAR